MAFESDDKYLAFRKLFQHERSVHEVLGGGKVADVLLWRNRNVSAALLIGMSILWFLFEVVEYNPVTLLCHILITTMLVLFIWSTLADLFKCSPPKIPGIPLEDSTITDLASTFHRRTKQLLSVFLDIAYGTDLPLFVVAIFSLYVLSVIGAYFSMMNLLYFGFLCLEILPFVYERYEEEIDHLAGNIILEFKRMYGRFDKEFLNKIPRGRVKEKKTN